MKQTMLIFCALLLAGSMAACSTAGTGGQSSMAQSEASQPAESAVPEPAEPEDVTEIPATTPPTVAGAALYRGTVTGVEKKENGVEVQLEQAKGTDYGHKTLQVLLGEEDTRADFDLAEIEEGMHLEIYYGAPMGGEPEQPVQAIQASLLAEADMTIFNGTVESILLPEASETGEGTLEMKNLETGETILFHYTDETQFYLNFDELAEGDELNIFSSGVTTRSIPPQAFALEVRPYTAPGDVE